MSYVTLSQTLSEGDNTQSTNYGSPFERYMAELVLLRLCAEGIDAVVSLNEVAYNPWDDLVVEFQNKFFCFQLKHTKCVKKDKFKKCLRQRGDVLAYHQRCGKTSAVTFVYLTTATATEALLRSPRVPTPCAFYLTNDHVHYDAATSTYFCLNQHNYAHAPNDVYEALLKLIGEDYASKDFVRTLQVTFNEYIRKRFHRQIKPLDPLTTEEIRQHVGYALLSQFLIPYAHSPNRHHLSNTLKEKLKNRRILVLNQRLRSSIKDNIWRYLVKLPRGRRHVINEWVFGDELHMPLLSPKFTTDRRILRALQIMNFRCKVVILRPRAYRNDLAKTILSGLEVAGDFNHDGEVLKYVEVRPGDLEDVETLHDDLFCKLAKEFGADGECILEAHDEVGYVNEAVVVGGVSMAPLTALVNTPGVRVDAVKDLIQRGADLKAAVAGGFTALHFAAKTNRVDVAEALLLGGAAPDPVDTFGNTPLFTSCAEGKTEMVEVLLKHGSNRYKADASGATPIFKAYAGKHYKIIRLLLKDNKNPTAANASGNHILHLAAFDGDLECLKCVLESFSDAKRFLTANGAGKTPLGIARENNHVEFVEMWKGI